jgi:hypothetical protein
VIATMLYGVRATDPWTYAGAALVFLAAALAVSYVPERRATRMDAATALRL